jgi:hypothetical protein
MIYYKKGIITSNPLIESVINPTQEKILENGWLIYIDIAPEYSSETQKIEKVGVTESNGTATVEYQIIELTEDELRDKNVPVKISQLQGKLLLAQMGLIDQIEEMINQSGRSEKIYWTSATEWERTSPILNRLAPTIGMSQADLDQFFINASKLY